jgi:hypothetical protein
MKKIQIIPLAALLCICFCFAECRKNKSPASDNPYGLPNTTQSGANIFACRVDDSNWIVGAYSSHPATFFSTSFHNKNSRDTLEIGASLSSNTALPLNLIVFQINSKIQEGKTYRLNDTTKAFVRTWRELAPCGSTVGYGGSQWNYATDGYITITRFNGTYSIPNCCSYGDYDRNSIISGTFNFIVAVPDCDSIKITDGRFDINYSQF